MKCLPIDKTLYFSNATIGISRSRWRNFPVLHDAGSREDAKEVAREIKVVADYLEVSAIFLEATSKRESKERPTSSKQCRGRPAR